MNANEINLMSEDRRQQTGKAYQPAPAEGGEPVRDGIARKPGLFTPDWDVQHWAEILIEATEHLLDHHNCHGPRYEEFTHAARAGAKWIDGHALNSKALEELVEAAEAYMNYSSIGNGAKLNCAIAKAKGEGE